MNDFPEKSSLATRLAALQQHLQVANEARLKGGASLRAVTPWVPCSAATLIGASKGQPIAALGEAIRSGLNDFGENRVQEAYEKWPGLKTAHPALRLHLIGPLQSNKAADAVRLFDVIHTVDRAKIAEALAIEMRAQGKFIPEAENVDARHSPQKASQQSRHPALTLLIQVNIGEEPQKSGVMPAELPALLETCTALGLTISGLMCVPPAGQNPAPYFACMQTLAHRHGLPELSMGMSGDFATALRFGATMVRVGTSLFGERQ